ncbi:tail protein [Pseudomonas phage vB_PpuP-Villemi]
MAFITELDIVNACLQSMGRSPINSVASGSPIIASALASLRTCMMQEQAIGWWFNNEVVKLSAQTNGQVSCPADTLKLTTDQNPPWLSTRGQLLYDNRIGDYFTTTGQITVALTRLIPLDKLPYQAAMLVQCASVLNFQKAFDADAAKIDTASQDYRKALSLMNTEHIRSVQANMLYQGSAGMRVQRTRDVTCPDGRWRR